MALRAPVGRSSSLATSVTNINTGNSPINGINPLQNPTLSSLASRELARKASLNALTAAQNTSPTFNKMASEGAIGGADIEVGDLVDVPGAMHGVVRFVGSVRGKKGVFAGVELSKEFASKGKNDGDVDGVRYFSTTVPGSGIFLPLHRASKRTSQGSSDFPPTPTTPSFESSSMQMPQQSTLPKFSQSMGPGARPPSPLYKSSKGRQSLPRPESPLRKAPVLAPTPGRGPSLGPAAFSRSQIGAPRFTPSPGPKASSKTPQPSKVRTSSRTGSRMSIDTGAVDPPASMQPPTRSSDGSGITTTSLGSGFTPSRKSLDDANEENARLKKQLDDRDKQLKEQASSLAEMEGSLMELQSLIAGPDGPQRMAGVNDDADSTQLRAIIREKNEKISMLTAEFDAHRADLRSTLDALELAGTETVRVYEKRVEELMAEIKDLNERNDDVDKVSKQLKSLEDLVQELEESVEDARRGEAEARGEAEFLRGEVERTKTELRREREKSHAALVSAEENLRQASDHRDLEQRDDEIRGLKAIIHSLSSGPDLSETSHNNFNRGSGMSSEESSRMQASIERLEREKKELQGLVERKVAREEELEQEIETLQLQQRSSVISNAFSDRTAIQEKRSSGRDSKGTVLNWRDRQDGHAPVLNGSSRLGSSGIDGSKVSAVNKATIPEAATDTASSTGGSAVLWCEICESGGHDILTCPNIETPKPGTEKTPSANNFSLFTTGAGASNGDATAQHNKNMSSISSQDPDKPRPLMTSAGSSANSTLNAKPSSTIMTPSSPSPNPSMSLPPLPGAAPTGPLPRPNLLSMSTGSSSSFNTLSQQQSPSQSNKIQDVRRPSLEAALVPGKDGSRNANKWCAICEHDGHDSINCALEDQF